MLHKDLWVTHNEREQDPVVHATTPTPTMLSVCLFLMENCSQRISLITEV